MNTRNLRDTRREFHVVSTLPESGERSPELSALIGRTTLIGFEPKPPRVTKLGPPFVQAPHVDDARTAYLAVDELLGRRAAELIDAAADEPDTTPYAPAAGRSPASGSQPSAFRAAFTPLRVGMLLLAVFAALLLIGKPMLKKAFASAQPSKAAHASASAAPAPRAPKPDTRAAKLAAAEKLPAASAPGLPAEAGGVLELRAEPEEPPVVPAGLSEARAAADKLAAGDLEGALALYTHLASLDPDKGAYSEARDILARRTSRPAR